MKIHISLVFFFILITFFGRINNAYATSQQFSEAIIDTIHEKGTSVELKITTKREPIENRVFIITLDTQNLNQYPKLKTGQEIFVSYIKEDNGNETVYFADITRKEGLYVLLATFLLLVLWIGRWHGFKGLISMVLSGIVLFGIMIPLIIHGHNPSLMVIICSFFIIPISFYISHGFSVQTHIAVISTTLTYIVVILLSYLFSALLVITGNASGEAVFLQNTMNTQIDLQALYIAGILLGVIGVLDDVTISQAVIVKKLLQVEGTKHIRHVAHEATELGRIHIASLVNTLVLVYVGASLPLMVLFYIGTMPSFLVVNQEIILAEIVRMLVASMGIILAVPFTTYIAIYYFRNFKKS